jgi:ABC-type glycerol-3-phosphate transport system substrate-binding protein
MIRKELPILLAIIIAVPLIVSGCAPTTSPTEEPPEPTATRLEPTQVESEPTNSPIESTETLPVTEPTTEPEPTDPPAPVGPDPSGQYIEFWHPWGYGIQYDTMQAIIEEFNNNNEWFIHIEAINIGSYSDIEEAINEGIQSGDLPNLVVAYSSSLADWLQKDIMVDMDALVYNQQHGLTQEEIADFFKTAYLGPVLQNGIRVGFPISQSVNVIYYNSTWAKELGFDFAPKSINEFKDQACAATAANAGDDNPDNDGTGGLVMYTGSSNVVSWIFSFGGDIVSDDGSGYDFTTPETEAVAVFLKEIWDDGCALMTQGYPHPEFATRRALFIMNSSVGIPYQLSAFEADDAFVADEWIFIPFVGPEGGEAVNAFSQTIGILNSTPEKNLAAWLFLKHLSSPETQATWINGSAYYPSRKSVTALLTDYAAANPQWKTGLELLSVGRSEPARTSWATVRREVQNTFSAVLQGDYDQIVPLLEELDAIAAEAVAELDH